MEYYEAVTCCICGAKINSKCAWSGPDLDNAPDWVCERCGMEGWTLGGTAESEER